MYCRSLNTVADLYAHFLYTLGRAVTTGTVGPVSTGPQSSGCLVPRPQEGAGNETNSHARVQLCLRNRLF